jgi:hypothetical protein
MSEQQERRRFHRFPFDADCRLVIGAGEALPCELLDLSINGALVALSVGLDEPTVLDGELRLDLRGKVHGDEVELHAVIKAVRVEPGRVACRFMGMDADSFQGLTSLVAENLGDIQLLDRELTQLDYWPGLSISPGG